MLIDILTTALIVGIGILVMISSMAIAFVIFMASILTACVAVLVTFFEMAKVVI